MYKIALFFLLLITFSTFAQKNGSINYSFIDDKQFAEVNDFYGFTFVPHKARLNTSLHDHVIPAGWVTFYMTGFQVKIQEQVSFRPGGIRSQRNDNEEIVLRITQVEDLGTTVKFRLTEPQHPDIHGFLTFYLDGLSRVKIIKYAPGPGETDRIYTLKFASQEQLEADMNYYTLNQSKKYDDLDLLWGDTIKPFFEIENPYSFNSRVTKRINRQDKVEITFEGDPNAKGKDKKNPKWIRIKGKGVDNLELVYKSSKITSLSSPYGKVKAQEITATIEGKKDEYFIYLIKGVLNYIRAVEIQTVEGKERVTPYFYELKVGRKKK